MILRAARWTMYATLPSEVVLLILLVSGVVLPSWVTLGVAVAAAGGVSLTLAAGWPAYRIARRARVRRWTALRHAVGTVVPLRVRRVMGFDTKGLVSLVLWAARRKHGVPPGATEVSYWREPLPVLLLWIFVMAVEAVATELVLRAVGAPFGLRMVLLALDLYGLLIGIAVAAAMVTRPHVVTDDELRIRSGAFFDLRVPRELIESVRVARRFDEKSQIRAEDGQLAVSAGSQTSVVVHLSAPVTFMRPLGRTGEATTIRFFADAPREAAAALAAERGAVAA